MSTLDTYTSGTRPLASANTGLCIFRSDTKAIEVSDGTDWLAYDNDGIFVTPESNAFSGSFDGNADWIDCNVLSAYQGASSLTMSFWWKPNSAGIGPSIGSRSSTSHQWGFLTSGGTNYVIIETGNSNELATFTAPNDTIFHHYLLSWSAGSASLYIDGVATTMTGDFDTVLHSQAADFEIGRFSSSFYAHGLFDEVALWSVALNSSNAVQIYNLGSIMDLSTDVGDYNQSSNLTHWWRIGDHASDTSSGGGAVADGNVIGNVENAANPGTNDGTGSAAVYSSIKP